MTKSAGQILTDLTPSRTRLDTTDTHQYGLSKVSDMQGVGWRWKLQLLGLAIQQGPPRESRCHWLNVLCGAARADQLMGIGSDTTCMGQRTILHFDDC